MVNNYTNNGWKQLKLLPKFPFFNKQSDVDISAEKVITFQEVVIPSPLYNSISQQW